MENNTIIIHPSKLDLRLAHLRVIPEKSINAMVKSLEKEGQLTPVVASKEGEHLILIDGFKRQRAAEILKIKQIMVATFYVKEAMMKASIYLLNRNSGYSVIEEGMLIRELVEKEGLMEVEVAEMLQRHKSWVNRRLGMIRNLAEEILNDIKLGLIPIGSGLMLTRLPVSNQVDLGAIIQRHKLNVQQSRVLIDLWCKAKDYETRKFLKESPQNAINIACGYIDGEENYPIPDKARKWLKSINSLKNIAVTLQQRSKDPIGPIDEDLFKKLDNMFMQTENECNKALKEAKECLMLWRQNE